MRPRRRTALNWRMRRTRRDALPSIQKEGSSPRRTVLASVGCRTCRETHMCVQGQVRRSTYVLQRLAAQRRSRLSAPTLSTLRGRPGGQLLLIYGSSLAGGRRAGKQNASPAPYSPELANATDPARCASFHPKRRVLASSYRFGFSRVPNLSAARRVCGVFRRLSSVLLTTPCPSLVA